MAQSVSSRTLYAAAGGLAHPSEAYARGRERTRACRSVSGFATGGEDIPTLGPVELVIILLIMIELFGANRVGDIFGAVGSGFRQFRAKVREEPAAKDSPKPSA